MPLHPALVHLPLGLAILMPLLAAGFGWAFWTGRVRLRAWLAVVGLQALLLTSGLVALQTGRSEGERVETAVSEAAIEQHEEAAEVFLWAVGVTLLLSAVALAMPRPGASKAAVLVSTLAMAACAVLAIRVGHAGGQVVYANGGTASAFSSGATNQNAGGKGETAAPATGKKDNDDDDRKK